MCYIVGYEVMVSKNKTTDMMSLTIYRMTQSHHMTSQTTASADPGDALNPRKLGGTEKQEGQKRYLIWCTNQKCQIFMKLSIASNDHTEANDLYHNLGKLF